MQRECRRVFFSGRVQGVGFRYTTHHLARGFKIAGFVRNLSDGRVEVVAEGEPAEIEGFLRAIRDAMGRFIRDVLVESCPPPPSLSNDFAIRYE